MATNSLCLGGNLTRDFTFNKGIATSGIAVSTWDKKTFFVDLVAFKNSADYIIKNKFKKGEKVVVSGELNINTYNDKKYVQCIIKEIQRFSKKTDDDVVLVESGASLGQPTGDIDVSDDVSVDMVDDDLPF